MKSTGRAGVSPAPCVGLFAESSRSRPGRQGAGLPKPRVKISNGRVGGQNATQEGRSLHTSGIRLGRSNLRADDLQDPGEQSQDMIKITARVGNIVSVAADAIVNAANNELWMGSGVAGAIKAAGGQQIEDEAMRQGPIARGEAVITGAGRLTNCRYVIHAAAMGGAEWMPTSESIREATLNSLRRAAEAGLETVAFPALGTGVGGFPLEAAAREMSHTVHQFEREQPQSSLKSVMFVLRDGGALAEFERGLERERPTSSEL